MWPLRQAPYRDCFYRNYFLYFSALFETCFCRNRFAFSLLRGIERKRFLILIMITSMFTCSVRQRI